jgi:hypothetical protein
MRGAGVVLRFHPVLRWLDLGVDLGVLLEQVEQVGARQQLQWLVVGEVEGRLAEPGCSDEDPFVGAFIVDAAEQVSYGADGDGVLVALAWMMTLPPKMERLS